MKNMTPTGFGKELRKIRVDWGESQSDMARRLGVSPAALSMIERGERSIPLGMALRVKEEYGLSGEAEARLAEAMSEANCFLCLRGATACQKETAALFGRRFRDLTDAQCEAIKAALQG